MQNFTAANDQYLESLRHKSADSAFVWLTDCKQPDSQHVAIMRAAYSTARLGDEAIKAVLSGDGWGELFRDSYSFDDWRDDWSYGDREPDELFQLAIGFVIGAARAWTAVRKTLAGVEVLA